MPNSTLNDYQYNSYTPKNIIVVSHSSDSTVQYIGIAEMGMVSSEPHWKILKKTTVGTDTNIKTYPDSVWDDRESL